MDSDQGAPAPSQTAENGNVAVLLGLYLLLLAFFILLVAISRIAETRSSAALNSVNGAFSTADASPPVALAPIVTGPIVDIEEFQGRIRTAVEAALPVAEIVVARNGQVLRVRVSTNVAFVREGAHLSQAMPPFLERLAGAMRLTAEDWRAEVELRVGARDIAEPTAGGNPALAVRRAGLLARAMVAAGIAPEAIATGLDAELAALEFRFAVVPAGAARVTFEDLAITP